MKRQLHKIEKLGLQSVQAMKKKTNLMIELKDREQQIQELEHNADQLRQSVERSMLERSKQQQDLNEHKIRCTAEFSRLENQEKKVLTQLETSYKIIRELEEKLVNDHPSKKLRKSLRLEVKRLAKANKTKMD